MNMQRTETAPHPFRWTREAYHRLGELSFFPQNRRVELIEGEIIQMSPIGPRHGIIVDSLSNLFAQRLASLAICRTQGPCSIADSSEPEPDLLLMQPDRRRYLHGHPKAEDIFLVIEVSSTSAEFDLTKKMEIYASAGIPEYWVVDLNRDLVVVHREPMGNRYAEVRECGTDDVVVPKAFADIELAVRDILLLD